MYKVLFVCVFLAVMFLIPGSKPSWAQGPVHGMALMTASDDGSQNSLAAASFVFDSTTSRTFLRADGSAVRLKDVTVRNDSDTPLESMTWCYYWGQNNEYTNIFSEDEEGYLDIDYYMYQHSTYGWGMCVVTFFRYPLQVGEMYTYSDSITIRYHNQVVGDVIYASWWTDPSVVVSSYVEDVRWPFNHNGVVADPPPDVLNPAQALWYRTNQDGIFTVDLQITLGDTMAVAPLSQGTEPFDGQDISWEDDDYGVGTGESIGSAGCHVTASAMAMNYFADILGVAGEIDPSVLNDWLASPLNGIPGSRPRGYAYCGEGNGYCAVDNTMLAAASRALFNATEPVIVFYPPFEIVQTIDDFRDNLQSGQLGLLRVNNLGTRHFVLVTGITEINNVETLSINDPYGNRGSTTLYEHYGNNHLGSVRWFGPGNESVRANYVTVQANSPVHFVVTDKYGRRAGYDPVTETSYNEIPVGAYYVDYPPDSPIDGNVEFKVFEAQVLEDNTYRVEVVGTADGPYTLSFQGVTDGGEVDVDTFTGEIKEGEVQEFTLHYDSDEGLTYKVYLPIIVR